MTAPDPCPSERTDEPVPPQAPHPGSGVVVHLDEGAQEKHSSVLGNITNLLADLGGATPVELVCHGPGVDLCLRDSPLREQLEGLITQGVTVAACRNTMRGRGIEPGQLAPGVVVVPAGIGELVRKQQQGWAYVRP